MREAGFISITSKRKSITIFLPFIFLSSLLLM